MASMDEIAAEALVNQLKSTNHWLSEIVGVLDRMQQYMDRIDTRLERMNEHLERIYQEL
jgi:hypothetical protein